MKKKILFVTQALWIGGIETALVNLLNHLDYDKFDISCLITEDYQQMAEHITPKCRLLVADRQKRVSFAEEYRFKRLYNLMEKPCNAGKGRMLVWKMLCLLFRALEMRLYARYIRKQQGQETFDTAVIYSDRVAELAVRAIRADRFLMFYHNADLGMAYHDEIGYKASEKIIAVSKSQSEKLKKLRPKHAQKIIAIPNYVDVEATLGRASRQSEYPLFVDGSIHLVSCGRLAEQKGFDIAVKACALLVKVGFSDLHWHILGTGPDRDNLEQLAREYQVEDHFHLEGVKSNPFPYMMAADLYVQPSRSEGYSLSVLEARVLACPTVATYAAAAEQLENGVTGTLCETTAEDVAAAIKKHLQHPEISRQYRAQLQAYSFEKENEAILKRIEALL